MFLLQVFLYCITRFVESIRMAIIAFQSYKTLNSLLGWY